MLGICAVLDLVFGGRSGVLGLAGFVTLPSGEIVSLWQFLGIMMGSREETCVHGLSNSASGLGGGKLGASLVGMRLGGMCIYAWYIPLLTRAVWCESCQVVS